MLHFNRPRRPPWLRFTKPFRRYKDPNTEFAKELMAIDQQRVKAFLDVIAELALADAERGQEQYTVRIVPKLRIANAHKR